MKGIPHHMLDIADIDQDFSVLLYVQKTLPIIEDILARKKTPIICGGTGQYLDAIMYTNTPPEVPPNTTLRKKLATYSLDELHKELTKLDARRAATVDKHNRVRLVRAIEIAHAIGSVPEQQSIIPRYKITMYLLNPSKEVLEQRVHARLLKRFEAGMIEEFTNLVSSGYDPKIIAKRGIEYKHISNYLAGKYTYEELIERLRIATWQYAKRQRTWNKKYLARKVPIDELHVVES